MEGRVGAAGSTATTCTRSGQATAIALLLVPKSIPQPRASTEARAYQAGWVCSDAQYMQRRARSGIADRHSGHSLVGSGAGPLA